MSIQFEQEVITFLEQATKSESGAIKASTELIDSGIVDSLSIVGLIALLEAKTKSLISFEEIDLDDFRSVENIVFKFAEKII